MMSYKENMIQSNIHFIPSTTSQDLYTLSQQKKQGKPD